jgi:hypothetical protein
MNPLVSIPPTQRPAIQELATLSEEAYDALRQCVVDAPASAQPDALLEHTSKAIEGRTALGGQILASVIGLRSFTDRSNMSVAEVAASVASDAEAKSYAPAGTKALLENRLAELLEASAVAISAKAFSLIISDAAPFSDVRIVSDVRPIFSSYPDALDIRGSVIVHHSQIEVTGEGDDQHSTLTTNDLLRLKQTVERALDKDKKLRELLRSGPLNALEATSEETDR